MDEWIDAWHVWRVCGGVVEGQASNKETTKREREREREKNIVWRTDFFFLLLLLLPLLSMLTTVPPHLRCVLGFRALAKATNITVFSFALISCGHYVWCESQRRKEAQGMALAVVGMRQLQEKKRREEEDKREGEGGKSKIKTAQQEEAAALTEIRKSEENRSKKKEKDGVGGGWSFW